MLEQAQQRRKAGRAHPTQTGHFAALDCGTQIPFSMWVELRIVEPSPTLPGAAQ